MKKSRKAAILSVVPFLILFTLSLAFAGELSQPVYQVIEEMDVKVVMRDGVRLSANIYRPDDPGRFPVLLMRTPYGNGGPDNKGAHFWAKRGYAVVMQDTRGRYESEGVFDPMQAERLDGYDTQQWVGARPWCNGKIGTFGGSYVGFTQWISAPLQSPFLITMFPQVTVADFHDMAYYGGAFRLRMWSAWGYWITAPYDFDMDRFAGDIDDINLSLPLTEQDKLAGWKVSFLRDWLAHPEDGLYWDRLCIRDGYKKITASAFSIGGWFDICLSGTLTNFIEMTAPDMAPEIRKKQKLLIGPWVHGMTKDGKVGELDFGKDAVINVRELQLRWFDSRLKGIDTQIMDEAPVKIYVMGDNVWRDEQEWPLARTDYRKYYFHSKGNANTLNGDGFLDTRQPSDSPAGKSDRFTYNPGNPVPSTADGSSFQAMRAGPADQRSIEEREDVLVYSTPPLKKDIEVTGPVEVILYAASSAPNTDFTAKLNDVYPDGRSMRLCDGIIRASFRDSERYRSNIEPGRVYEYHIDLWATSNVFKKGHRIRVEISSSNFPRFDRNLNTGGINAADSTFVSAEQTIYHTKEYPSCIVLPVIE